MARGNKDLVLQKSISINAAAPHVWAALTDPGIIKLWLFGTNVISDWKVGGSILFTGNWQGTEYMDKGTILEYESEKTLKYNYWSGFSGLPDIPENYSVITFTLTPRENDCVLTLRQTNFATETMYQHSDTNWDATLDTLKKVIEDKERISFNR
jgi:uncharacterized protein YndB with AHSA1/START domain